MDRDSIPIGIEDFKKLRSGGGYYVDKTRLIGQILSQNMTEVFLFTRPRRFGKSLNLSMLDAYLNLNYKGNDWFDGLEISRTDRFDSDRNGNPVICLNMKGLSGPYDSFIARLKERIADVCRGFDVLSTSKQLDDNQRKTYASYRNEDSTVEKLQSSLKNISDYLALHYGKPVVILIDEYDDPVNRSEGSERLRIIDFMREFLSYALKGNGSLRFAVITGVMQIAKAEFFSGLNNPYMNNVFSDKYDEMFGFTPGEVERICADFGRPDKFEEAREWYDGYRFGNADIYNPWSVLMYVFESFKPAAYWVRTSGNAIISTVLNSIDEVSAMTMAELLAGGTAHADLMPAIAYSDLDDADSDDLFSILAMAGYLNAIPTGGHIDGGYRISLPNKEIRDVFRKEVYTHINGMKGAKYVRFIDAVMDSDVQAMRVQLLRVLKSISSRLLPNPDESIEAMDCKFREANYHVMMLSILDVANELFDIRGDMEAGDGRSDISMRSLNPSKPNIIMELKWSGDMDTDMDAMAQSALDQIHERKYALGMEGRTILYGIAFRKRDVCIRTEILE